MRRGNIFFKFLSISNSLFLFLDIICVIRCTKVTFGDELMLFESFSKLTVCGFVASFNVFSLYPIPNQLLAVNFDT